MAAVTVIMGSISDLEIMKPCMKILKELQIDSFVTVSSAHRTPQRTEKLITEAEQNGTKVFICAAGMAAHLAGAVAARTLKPVIAVPVAGSSLAGMDALFSSVQMPPGFPVATVALNGAKNAAWLAAQILAVNNETLASKLANFRREMIEDVEKTAEKVEKENWL